MKFSEIEIQEYLWSQREHFADFLVDTSILNEIKCLDDLSDLTAQALVRNMITKKLKEMYFSLHSLELIGSEVPLEQLLNSTIRADFLAVFPGDTGVGIIELKKSSQTERQAFTELLAYSNHITTLFPGMSREDIVYILISPMVTRIARDAVIQSLTFDNRKIVALIPELTDPDDLTTLKLRLWVPTDSELYSFSRLAFRENNFNVCKIVWEYCEGRWDAAKGKYLSPGLVEQLNSVSAMAAQYMEEAGIHGFTYCSQLWPELEPSLPFTNSLVLVGLNPYAVGSMQFLANCENIATVDLPSPHEYIPNITELIPGLKNSASSLHEDTHYLEDLHRVWDSQLFRIGQRVVDSATQNITGKSLQTSYGFMDWHTYQRQLLEDVYCENFLVRPTGLLRHLFSDVTRLDYELCGKYGVENHPIHGDIYYNAIETLTSQSFFRKFIQRMLGDDECD